jgi:hypothetical protein
MPALTRAEARDVIRRDKLKKLTSVEEWEIFGMGNNRVGDPASSHPTPTNVQLNSQLRLAVGWVNRKCRLGHLQDVEVSVAAQTEDGPLAIDLRVAGVNTQNLAPGDITQIKWAYFDEGDGTTYRVLPRGRETFDIEGGLQFQQRPVSRSRWFWIEGYTLYLLPGPDTAGTLHLVAGTGILTFRDDADSLANLPTEYHDVVWDTAAWMIARNEPNDVEMLAVAQILQPLVMDGIKDILEWKRDISAQQEGGMTPMSDRRFSRRSGRGRVGTNDYLNQPWDCE